MEVLTIKSEFLRIIISHSIRYDGKLLFYCINSKNQNYREVYPGAEFITLRHPLEEYLRSKSLCKIYI